MPLRKRYHYRPDEDAVISRIYPTRGAKVTSESLARKGFIRTPLSVSCRARKLGIGYDPESCNKLVPLHLVHPDRGDGARSTPAADRNAVRAAKADGVVTQGRVPPRVLMVPAEWADRYVEQLAAKAERLGVVVRTWLPSEKVAKLFDVSVTSLYTARTENRCGAWVLYDHLHRIENVRLMGDRVAGERTFGRYWKPEDVYREAAAFRERPHFVQRRRRAA